MRVRNDKGAETVKDRSPFGILLLVSFAIVACGGSGGGTSNSRPVANAGSDQTVDERATVTIAATGTDNDGSIASYLWTQTQGTPVALSDANTVEIQFTAPTLIASETLTFQLVVTDNEGATNSDSVSITVNPVDECVDGLVDPAPPNHTVVLSATGDLEVVLGTRQVAFDVLDPCLPVFMQYTNAGSDPIYLSDIEAQQLSSRTITLGEEHPFLSAALVHSSGAAIGPGLFLLPGGSSTMSAVFSRERITLYSTPPLGGGVVTRHLNLTARHELIESTLDLAFDVDFGTLPEERIPDPGVAPGELLVSFRSDATFAEIEEMVARHGNHIMGGTTIRSGGIGLAVHVWIPFGTTTDVMMEILSNEPTVLYVERNIDYVIDEAEYGPTVQYEELDFPTRIDLVGGSFLCEIGDGLFTSEDDLENEFFPSECYELAPAIEFSAHSLVTFDSGVGGGCGESGIVLEGVTYEPDTGKVFVHLHGWDHQGCLAWFSFQKWLLIDRVPDDTVLQIIIREGGWG